MKVYELIDKFLEYVDDPEGDRWPRPMAMDLVNEAQGDIQQELVEADEGYFRQIQEYTVTSAENDSLEFDLPADFEKVISVEREGSGGTAPYRMKPVRFTERHTHDYTSYRVNSKYPARYYLVGDKIGVVNPRESFTMRLYYTRRLPDLSSEQDEPDIPRSAHSLISLHAARLAYSSEGRSFDLWEREYQRRLQAVRSNFEQRDRSEPRYVNWVDN